MVWVIVGSRSSGRCALAGVLARGLGAALYLRTGRFYSFAYLELAFMATVVFMGSCESRCSSARCGSAGRRQSSWRARSCSRAPRGPHRRSWWPPTCSYVLDTPAMSHYADRPVRSGSVASRSTKWSRGPVPIMVPVHLGPQSRAIRDRRHHRFLLSRMSSGGCTDRSSGFCRTTGTSGSCKPATTCYSQACSSGTGLLPVIVVGLGATGWRIVTRTETRFGVVFLWFFSAIYFAHTRRSTCRTASVTSCSPCCCSLRTWDCRTRRISPAGVHDMWVTG